MKTYKFDNYVMTLEDTGRVESRYGKAIVCYTFTNPGGVVLFSGEDLYCSPLHDPESPETARTLLLFLTLRPGDTDSEYFDNHTPEQMEFVNSLECDMLQIYTDEDFTPEED